MMHMHPRALCPRMNARGKIELSFYSLSIEDCKHHCNMKSISEYTGQKNEGE